MKYIVTDEYGDIQQMEYHKPKSTLWAVASLCVGGLLVLGVMIF